MSKVKAGDWRKRRKGRLLPYAAAGAVVVAAAVGLFFLAGSWPPGEAGRPWSIDDAGRLRFADSGGVTASIVAESSTGEYSLQTVRYGSLGDDVYAELMVPRNVTRPAVVIVLPAMTITKEENRPTALALCAMGYATLTLDERGNGGQTGGEAQNDWSSGYSEYLAGGDPVQYRQVHDVLAAYEYVRARGDLDGGNVSLLGESIGGMWAIVACGLQPGFKGAVTVSSCDFGFSAGQDASFARFAGAVQPSSYLTCLPPRRLAMFQFTDDPIVSLEDGRSLYDMAREPKSWHQYNGSTHGLWDPVMGEDVRRELEAMLGR